MLFFLRKFIEALSLPLGISVFLILAGVVFRRRKVAIAGVMVLLVFSLPDWGRLMLAPLERAYPAKTVGAAPQADAIVVLSGGIVRGRSAPGVQWGEAINRYYGGYDLASAGKAKLLVFSAGDVDDDSISQGAVMRDTAIHNGIAPERIFVTKSVQTTEDEARAVSQIPDVHSILLVTSAYHMPRAVLIFRAHGLNVSPFPTDQRVLRRKRVNPLEFVPDVKGLQTSETAMREYYGLAVYEALYFFRPLGKLQ